jgi:UDP-N-acetylglucosamine 2-epimerase (hydrolysing)
MNRKKIVFLTGTRADFGKLKSLISITQKSKKYEVHLFVTGMHMNSFYGSTIDEIKKSGFNNIYPFINHESTDNMDRTLAKTIDGFSHFIAEIKPDLIVVHGDRVEAMAGAITGSLNNILVAHIEGGEVSGTIDELVRHAVSKMSHIHLVANKKAKNRLIQIGELPESIFILGSPDLDLMSPNMLAPLRDVNKHYDISFDTYAIAMFHSVTTEYNDIQKHAKHFVDALLKSNDNFIIIYPNNDLGSKTILMEYKRLEKNKKIKIFPSLKFEYFLTFLKNAEYIVGNSSSGIREASYYSTPAVDVGSRQNNRIKGLSIFHTSNDCNSILKGISLSKKFESRESKNISPFGKGNSDKLFLNILNEGSIWLTDHQKQFQDIDYE